MAARLVVEWTRTTLRLALAEGNGVRARLLAIRSQPFGMAGESAEALRTLLGKRPPAIRQVIGVIPREQVITRVVKFPTTRVAELRQMVEFYAKAQLPYPREQAVFDFHVVQQQAGFSTVAIIACQRDVVDHRLTLLREAGFSAIMLTVSSWGVLGWYRRAGLGAGAAEPSLVVNVDDTRTDLVLIADGRVISSRSVAQGARDWEMVGEIGELLALEIDRSRAAIRKELPGADVRSFLLTGLGPLAQWSDHIAKKLGVSVRAIEGSQPLKEWTTPLTTPISPVVVGGLACSEVRSLLNLSPLELRGQTRHRQQIKELILASVLLAGVLALGAGLLGVEVARQRRLASQIDRTLVQIEPAAKHTQEKSRSTQLVDSVLDERRRVAGLLSGVFRATPAAVTLEVVNFERGKRELIVRGSAGSTQDVLDYIAQLERLDGVDEVQLKYSTRRSTSAGERTDFELMLRS